MDGDSLYDSLIVRRAREPHHAGELADATAQAAGNNPLCGDRVALGVRVDGGRIAAARHVTKGCAICAASADLMAGSIEGRTLSEALDMAGRFHHMLGNGSAVELNDLPESMAAFLPLKTHRSRLRCATLPWTALEEALGHD
ncbi:Fe-S cluster assembly sulfur transfer protein SufU [Acetobacter sp. DsW_063]|uniref:Fe-S cluster assembly sulfur transfer protein SufU n=1 Tax=Acetobacter sp. DsW_063 TaxID=1514894 RepID=UPI000A39B26F|nr:SUF system NifU family Fe-S cluster assembly protein [Acetobacter sp. DsW_063]OUJ16315.1 nitrogen fixation protein NifU [Acetobacter sp. DsW_063]